MLRIFGNMQLVKMAGKPEEIEGFKVEAKRQGSDLLVEDGNFLYARAVFMSFDIPNGNGDAIPSIYAGTFGPSFIGKHVDVNHQLDPDSIIGRIMATWHRQIPLLPGDGPKVIGRNIFGRDIDGRPKVFGFAPSVEADPMELQLEGIFRIDRSSHAGDIMARKLIAKEIDSVSQEASTAYCLCPVCANKVSMPWDIPCQHLKPGSLMLKAYKVAGYEHEILAYKVHHEPVGTGLGCVGVPAYDKAKIPELVAALRNGHMTVQAFQQILQEQEMVWGKNMFVIQAGRELELVAADMAKPVSKPTTPTRPVPAQSPAAPIKTETPTIQPLTGGLREALNTLVPGDKDSRSELYRKLVSAAKAQGRVNREALSLTRHVAMAARALDSEREGALDGLAVRVSALAEVQATLDLTRHALMSALGFQPSKPGTADGQLLAADALGSIKVLAMALTSGAARHTLISAKNRIDGFMPAIKSLQTALHAEGKGIEGAAEVGALLVKAEAAQSEFTKRFDAWSAAEFPPESDQVKGNLARAVMASFVLFKTAYEMFEGAQIKLLVGDHSLVAKAVDAEFGLKGMMSGARRLRMRAGTMDLVAAFQSQKTEERSRAVIGAFYASTAEWLSDAEAKAIGLVQATTSVQAAVVVNGMSLVLAAMGPQNFDGGFKTLAYTCFNQARQKMTELVAAERLQAGQRVLARTWLKVLAINPSFDVKGSALQVLAESRSGLDLETSIKVGTEVQVAGGPWPWTGGKAVSWNEFVASKTDDELVVAGNEWKARLGSGFSVQGDIKCLVIEQNVVKLEALLKDRQAARGLVARFFRQPVLANSHWTLFNAEGKAVGRVTLVGAAGGSLDRRVQIEDKKVFLGSWLQSEQYGRDIVAHAKRHGLTATLNQFKVRAGGGAGIFFQNFELEDGGAGTVKEDGGVEWQTMPKLAKFDTEGYQDGMQGVRGDLLEIVGLDANLKGDCKPGDKVTLSKIDAKPVWQGGWIRNAPTAGEVIALDCSKGDFVFTVNDSFDAYAVSGDLNVKTTEDFVYFYQDVFDAGYASDEDVKDYCKENIIPLPENEGEMERIRTKMFEQYQDDARLNWGASKLLGRRRLRAGEGKKAVHYHSDMGHSHDNDDEGHSHGDPEKVQWKSDIPSSRYRRRADDAPGGKLRSMKEVRASEPRLRQLTMTLNQFEARSGHGRDSRPDMRMAKNGMPYESYQLSIHRPLGPTEHTHGGGSDTIRHAHGSYEPRHVHENTTGEKGVGSPEVQMEDQAWREGEGVQEQGLGEARGRKWIGGGRLKAIINKGCGKSLVSGKKCGETEADGSRTICSTCFENQLIPQTAEELLKRPGVKGGQEPHGFKRGQHVVDIFGGPDYDFHYIEDAPGVPGMIHLRNNSGMIVVPASEYKVAPETGVKGDQAPLITPPKKAQSEYDPKALAAGTKVELEHTTDRTLAANIAMNHLDEDTAYYEKLKQVEG